MVYNLKAVDSIIEAVRQAFPDGSVRILVGGYAFKASEGLWKRMGADGFASNALDAIRLAESLVPGDRFPR
jgi:MerR family transcriptional regulator, light-induced transcriptional regulator